MDVGGYTQAFNSLQGAYKTLGCLERKARTVRSLHEVRRDLERAERGTA
jgi:hypothetical protein